MMLASLALLASQPATVTAHAAPIHCNPDPLKGAACHASAEQARAETRRNAARGDELAAAN